MKHYANPDDVLKQLPPSTFAFLENLIAKLEVDAQEDGLPNEARQELLTHVQHTRTALRACRERDVMTAVLVEGRAELVPAHPQALPRT